MTPPQLNVTVSPEAIRSIRVAIGLSVTDLAVQAQIDRTQLWRIERGDATPRASTLRRIADALGVPVSALRKVTTEDAA